MDPGQGSAVDPQRRYQSMMATVSILNQARRRTRRRVPSLLANNSGSSAPSSSVVTTASIASSSADQRSPSKPKARWHTAVSSMVTGGRLPGSSVREEQPPLPPLQQHLPGHTTSAQSGESWQSAASSATAELALKRKKLRKWRHNRKRTLYLKFRRVAWMAIIIRRICRMHYIDVSDASDQSFAQASSSRDRIDVMFDVTQFRAKKHKLLSQEARRILQTSPEKRTAQEMYYVQIALRELKAIAGYPVRMQKSLSEVCWFEAYGPTRVIVREGHPPRSFYFIYSGSVVVTVLEPGRLTQRTVAIMRRGDSFGELAILNHGTRTSTITAKEDLELIVISAEDFMKIFMSGGVKRLTDPDHLAFIRSIDFLKGWPIHLLDLHPKQCVFNFFRHDTVLVRDSKCSDWIYIVKSGSVSVVVRLGRANSKKTQSKEKKGATNSRSQISAHRLTASRHEARLASRLAGLGQAGSAHSPSQHSLYELPVLRVSVHGPTPSNYTGADEGGGAAGTEATGAPRFAMETSTMYSDSVKNKEDNLADELQGATFGPRRTFADDLNANQVQPITSEAGSPDERPVFACVRTLVKGEAFGLAELMFSDQPSLSLVSKGAECVVLSKQFFLDHAPDHLLHLVRISVTPYGSVDELQVNLERELSWQHYRDSTLRRTVDQLRTKRAPFNQATQPFL